MENNTLSIEKQKLKEVLAKYKEVIEDYKLTLKGLPSMYRDNPQLMANLSQSYEKKLKLLAASLDKPYFARIDFRHDSESHIEQCYISKVGVMDSDNKIVTVDWRAPIASMYYDSNIGRASYEAPEGTITGDMLIKRQYEIELGELLGYQDVDTVANDDILKPYLGANADNRLKNIVSTIQAEQNDIIREKLKKNLIIQGVAGSGKTTVALHRIAYLVYNNFKNIKPDQYMVIGPNKFFINYISSVLPDLDVNDVEQLTYDELVKEFVGEDFEINSSSTKLIQSISEKNDLSLDRFKTSMAYKKGLDEFMIDFDKTVVPTEDFAIKGVTILPASLIASTYDETRQDYYDNIQARVDRACLLLSAYVEKNYENLVSKAQNSIYEQFKLLGNDKEKVEKLKKDAQIINKELGNFCRQSLKKHFSKTNTKIFTLYNEFINNTEFYLSVDTKQVDQLKKQTGKNVRTKKIDFEDLAAILYLKYKMSGVGEFKKYRHTVVDEAQDFGEFNFYVLNKIMPNGTFSIFGDLAQSIYNYRSIDNWEAVAEESFNNNCDVRKLLKSYRTTMEIMDSANNVTDHIGLNTANPVIRHGNEVHFSQFSKNQNEYILQKLSEFVKKGYKSIAVISKTEAESNQIHQALENLELEVHNIASSNIEYKGGICTITGYLAKGLEFDAVIITNASEKQYSSNKVIDMKLLYVAMTRPLHELEILYEGELTKPLQKCLVKENTNTIKK